MRKVLPVRPLKSPAPYAWFLKWFRRPPSFRLDRSSSFAAKIFIQRFVTGTFQQSLQLRIASDFLSEILSVCLTKSGNARIPVLPVYRTVLVTITTVQSLMRSSTALRRSSCNNAFHHFFNLLLTRL